MRKGKNYRGPARVAGLFGLTLLLLAVGCGGKYTPVPVSGVVTLNGKPVEAATIYFYAFGDEKDGRPAFGTTDNNGKFQLSTMGNNDGALPRNYKVVITKYVPTLPNLKIPEFPNTVEGRAQRDDFMYKNFAAKGIQPFTNSLPQKYGNTDSTPFSQNITGSANLKFEL